MSIEIREMKPHEKRVVEERDALQEKIGKLHDFIKSGSVIFVPLPERARLEAQLLHMRAYCDVLNERIQHF